MTTETVFLKLGGSLITDKDKPYTPRLDKLKELALEIKTVLDSTPDLLLILGHGSGSFGHTAAKKYGTRNGVQTTEQWHGFARGGSRVAQAKSYLLRDRDVARGGDCNGQRDPGGASAHDRALCVPV